MKKTAFGYLQQWYKTSKNKKKKNNNNTRNNDNWRRASILWSPLIYFVKLWALSIQPEIFEFSTRRQLVRSLLRNATIWEENQTGRKFPVRQFRTLGYNLRGCPLFRIPENVFFFFFANEKFPEMQTGIFDSMERALCLHEKQRSSNHLESESHIPPEDLLSESLRRSLPSMPGFLFTWTMNNSWSVTQ